MKNSSSKTSEATVETGEETIASPCRRVCCLDTRDVCLGCGRTLEEILEWGRADNARRREICADAHARRALFPH